MKQKEKIFVFIIKDFYSINITDKGHRQIMYWKKIFTISKNKKN